MPWWGILILILTILSGGCGVFLVIRRVKINQEIKAINQQLENKKQELDKEINNLLNNLQQQELNKNNLLKQISDLDNIAKKSKEQINNNTENLKEYALNSFEQYCDLLDIDLAEKEQEYDVAAGRLKDAYDLAQQKLLDELNKEKEQLQRVRETRSAAIEAFRKEQEIKEKLSFYCLRPTETELADVKKLEAIKPQLNNPRILSMLIWSTYFQKPMTILCNNVLGTKTVCGIYKITNQTNNMCYVGQSVKIGA